ncbi:MAG: F0F1 ATP synthase subunit B' [Pseudomonadota bacterium]
MADPYAGDAAKKAAESGPFPPFDPEYFTSSLFWLVVTFALLYWLLSKFAIPRIATVIEERQDQIADDLDQAAELKRQTDEAIASYEKALADAKAKAGAIAAETREKLDAEIADMRTKMEADLNEKTAAAEARITKAKDAAAANVRQVAVETAEAVVERLTGETADAGAAVDAVLARQA